MTKPDPMGLIRSQALALREDADLMKQLEEDRRVATAAENRKEYAAKMTLPWKANLPKGIKAGTNEDGTNWVQVSTNSADNPLQAFSGSSDHSFNMMLLRRVASAVHFVADENDPEINQRNMTAITSALAAFQPEDEIEGMIAAQAVAMSMNALECFKRSWSAGASTEAAARLRKDGANLSRAMGDMIDLLNRKRGKAQQVVRVERLVVQDGGQAVVGNVQTQGTRGGQKT